MLEKTIEEEGNRLEGAAAVLPPDITKVEYRITEAKEAGKVTAEYTLHWDNVGISNKYTIYLMENTAKAAEISIEGILQETIQAEVSKEAVCKIYMTPADAPELKSNIVTVPTQKLVVLEEVLCSGESLKLKYAIQENIVGINAVLENEEKGIYSNINLKPYEKIIDLSTVGIEEIQSLQCTVTAYAVNNTVQIWQIETAEDMAEVNRSIPAITELSCSGNEEEYFAVKAVISEDSPLADADICYFYLWEGERIVWQTQAAMKESQAVLRIPVSEYLLAGGNRARSTVRLKKGKCVSEESARYPVLFDIPRQTRGEFADRENWNICFAPVAEPLKKEIILKKGTDTETMVCYEDTVSFSFRGVEAYTFRFRAGAAMGRLSEEYKLSGKLYQQDTEDSALICIGKQPGTIEHSEIRIPVVLRQQLAESISGEVFLLEKTEQGYAVVLKEGVWNQKEKEAREKIKQDYQEFLKKLDQGVAIKDIYEIRRLIGIYLPHYQEDAAWYSFGFGDNGCDLLPGMILRVEYNSYQKVDTVKYMEYLNGYVESGIADYPVLLRENSLCVDPAAYMLSDGTYAASVQQPDANNQAMAYGGAGMIELSQEGARKPYGRILYPTQFIEGKSQGEPYSILNEVLVFSETAAALSMAVSEFRNQSYSANGYFQHFRGRVHMVPWITVRINGCQAVMPAMSTLGDILIQNNSSYDMVCLKRGEAILRGGLVSREVTEGFLLQAGDEIWVNG